MNYPQGLLPILPLRNTLIFPGLSQVIKVGRDPSIRALKIAEKSGYWIVATQQKQKLSETGKEIPLLASDLYTTGTLCRIDSMKGNDENGYQVVLRGFIRVHIENPIFDEKELCFIGNSVERPDIHSINEPTEKVLLESLKELSLKILKLIPANTEQLIELVSGVTDLAFLTHLCAGNIELELSEKQKILETYDLKDRALLVLNLLKELKEGLEVQAEIRGKLNQKIGQSQRQNILREQLRTIRDELGEGSDSGSAEDKLRKKIEEADLPSDVRKIADSELQRFMEIGTQSPESHVIRNYLELLTALPWNKKSAEKEISLDEARQILDHDHYGIDKVKKRIIQQLAVMKLRKNNFKSQAKEDEQKPAENVSNPKGSILLFVGPPGVGKTSLGQSIAKALGRKFTRVSLGGVRDDAEIRGHRRTYVGALPGRIIQSLKRVGEKNPVFLLDEIDKLARSFAGDPAAALLEVLDPEQNHNFVDHYLDVGFDLSEVIFIATANQLDTIPGPLLDRMEIIELSGYTSAEKFHIAKNHLIPKQLTEQGLLENQIVFTDEALTRIISGYTREAGVRDLQRKIATCLRGMSEQVVKNLEQKNPDPVRIESIHLEELLGTEKFTQEVLDNLNHPGVATGMAWSPVGGSILSIEATMIPGKGDLLVTGQLGDVMKESAQIAMSLVKNLATQWLPRKDFSKHDIHIHVPAGAIPKDGPSAGVTLTTALASLVTHRPVKALLAMTGEITLQGRVLPVGGIKEKVIAAHRAGVKEIILPLRNQPDLKDIPDEVKSSLKIHFVSEAAEVLKLALDLEPSSLPEIVKSPDHKSGENGGSILPS